MTTAEKELEDRLYALPDADDWTWCTLLSLKENGLIDEALQFINDTPNATVGKVIEFECVYEGSIELFYDEAATRRVPVSSVRMRLTRGMRAFLAELKDKVFKSYECSSPEGRRGFADEVVRINLGRYALDAGCHVAAVRLGKTAPELAPLHCERVSTDDLFRSWSHEPSRVYMVDERVRGVDLVTERVPLVPELGGELAVDAGAVIRTPLGCHTLARESWTSTRLRVASADMPEMPYATEQLAAELERVFGPGSITGEPTREMERLA